VKINPTYQQNCLISALTAVEKETVSHIAAAHYR